MASKQVTVLFILALLFLAMPASAYDITPPGEHKLTPDGKYAYINTSNVSIIAANELHSTGWSTVNFTVKDNAIESTHLDVDFAFGFNTSNLKPKRAQLYKPHWENTTSQHQHTFYNVTYNGQYAGNNLDYGNLYNNHNCTVTHEVNTYNETTMEINGSKFITSNISYDTLEPDYKVDGYNHTAKWHTRHDKYVNWLNIPNDRFIVIPISFHGNYDDKNAWYGIIDQNITVGKEYQMRIWVEVPVKLGEHSYKYDIVVKPSAYNFSHANAARHLYILDPWWNTSWGYFKVATLNQTMINQTIGDVHYTVLFETTDTDFANSSQADGDDIVFVNSANTTQYPHQLSAWNSTTGYIKAYIGITDPSNVTSFNVYYNNSGATNTEDKAGTWGVNASGIWLMDEGAGSYVNDSSGNDNNGTITGADWNVSGGLDFDGVNDYVNAGNDASLNIIGDMTIIVWIKTTMTDNSGIINRYISSGDGYIIQINRFVGKLSYYNDGTGWITSTSIGYNDGNWHQVAITGTGTSGVLYKDDSPDGYFTYGNPISNTNDVWIGKDYSSKYFNGLIDPVRIYNRALSADEISTLYNNTNSPALFISLGAEQSDAAGDTTDPTYSGAAHNTTVAGASCKFSIQYNDDTALHTNGQYIFATNNTGTWVNESAVNWTATPEYANVTKTLNSTVGKVVGYRWYANDTAGNSNNTGIYTLTITAVTHQNVSGVWHFWTYENIPELHTGINDEAVLEYNTTLDIYTFHAPFYQNVSTDTFYYNETTHLKSNNGGSPAYFRWAGKVEFDEGSIIGWNTTANSSAPKTDTTRAYIYNDDDATGNITNMNMSYLGYNAHYGISLSKYCDMTIENNTMTNNYHGLSLLDNSKNNTINNNTITESDESGILISTACDNNTLSNNKVNSNDAYGIWLRVCGECDVNNNTVHSNLQHGFYLHVSDNNDLSYNTVYSNTFHGIYLSSSDNNELKHNNISDASGSYYDFIISGSVNTQITNSTKVSDYYKFDLTSSPVTFLNGIDYDISVTQDTVIQDNAVSGSESVNITVVSGTIDGINVSSLSATTNYSSYYSTNDTQIESKTTDGAGTANFTTNLNAETYYILETPVNEYTPPTPVSPTNTTGNFWVNFTWSAGSGNVTDSYNVSQNSTWVNGSSTAFNNSSVSAHGYSNIIVYAYNSSGTGTLSTANVTDNVTVPNNAINISNISASYTLNEGETLNIDADATDPDSDTPTFNDNSSEWNVNSGTGIVSWITTDGDQGTYNYYINVTDGYSSTDQYNFTVTVTDSTPTAISNLQNTTGNYWINWTWDAGSNADDYDIYINEADQGADITDLYHNETSSAHAVVNISVRSHNHTLSAYSAWTNDSMTIPNNAITITNTADWSGNEGQQVYLDFDYTDPDSDTGTFDTNATSGNLDTATGIYTWDTTDGDQGTYYINFNVTDGYSSVSSYVSTITIGDSTPTASTNIQNSTSGLQITWNWTIGSNSDYTVVHVNGSWYENSTDNEYIFTATPHGTHEIQLREYNTTLGTHSAYTNQTTTIPNNLVNLTGIPDKTTNQGVNLTNAFNLSDYFTDLDSDTPTFAVESNNDTTNLTVTIQGDNTVDFNVTASWDGTALVIFNVTDGYSSTDNDSILFSIVNASANQHNFTFSNSAITPVAIRENDPFTVRVDVNDSDGIITTAIVKISGNNYTMTSIGGDTWSYTFTATSLPTRYYVQNFYAQDNDSAWNSTTSTLYIDAVSSTGTGSSGGITPVTTPTPTPTPKPIEDEPIEELTDIITNISNTIEVLFFPYKTTIFRFNLKTDDRIYIKEMLIANMTECTYTPDLVKRCVVQDETVRITVNFDPDTAGLIYIHDDFIKLYDGTNYYHTEFDMYVINMMASINIPENNLINPSKLFFGSNEQGTISGVRIWWPLMLIIIAIILYFKKKGVAQ